MTEELWKNMADNITDALLVQDKHGNIIYANSAAVSLFGYTLSEGLTFNSYQLYEDGVLSIHILPELLRTKRTVNTVQVVVKKDLTRTKPLLVTLSPIFDENGEVLYAIEIIRDIDTLNQIHQNVLRQRGEQVNLGHGDIYKKYQPPKTFVISSPAMQQLIQVVDRVADSSANVLVQGESGTGKELLAEYIHNSSLHHKSKLIAINCAALPETLLESELFGYEQGAFTGAQKGKPGLIEMANDGTLFLDEIDSLPPALQGKLLRVIETKHVRRIGSVKSKLVNFRLISATNVNLEAAIEKKNFRADLYHRISTLLFVLPPLRERPEDVRPLCTYFLALFSEKYGREKRFSEKVLSRFESYAWPGNVRELRNVVERVVLMTDGNIELVNDIPPTIFTNSQAFLTIGSSDVRSKERNASGQLSFSFDAEKPLKDNVKSYEKWVIDQTVSKLGSLAKAAKQLKVDKSTLIRKRK
jgi:PAS domain S-box